MKHTYYHDIFKLSVTSETAAAAFSLLSMKLCDREALPSTGIFSEAFIWLHRLHQANSFQDILLNKYISQAIYILFHTNIIKYFKYLGFDQVYKGPLQFRNYIFSHEPVFIEKEIGLVNIHGHTHGKMVTEDYFFSEYNKSFPHKKVNPEQYKNICMDANNFQILKWKEIIKVCEDDYV